MQNPQSPNPRQKRQEGLISIKMLVWSFLLAILLVASLVLLGLKAFPNAYGPDNGIATPPAFSPVPNHNTNVSLSVNLVAPCHTADGKPVEPIGTKHGEAMEAIYIVTITATKKAVTVVKAEYDLEAVPATETLKGPPTCSTILPAHYWRFEWKDNSLSTLTTITPQPPLIASPGQPAVLSLMVIVDHKLIIEGSTVTVTVAVNGATVQLRAALPGKLYAYPWPGDQ